MNNKTIKSMVWGIVPALCLSFSACKSKAKDPDPQPAKTLNKTKLLDKLWQNQGGSIKHEFKSNGTYRFDGTWAWVNNSDTMEIESSLGVPKLKWKIYWNTDNEMTCEKIGTGGAILYKDQAW